MNAATCRISCLIAKLTKIQEQKGDLPLVFWDQVSMVKFDNLDHVIKVNSDHVLLGGFHVNGDESFDLEE
jgi:hypothetical protein